MVKNTPKTEAQPVPVKPAHVPIRTQGGAKMDFTEKYINNVPMRESYLKEPPFPKSKKLAKDEQDAKYTDIEE